MRLLKTLADRLVLQPTTHPIDSGELDQELLPSHQPGEALEAWTIHLENPAPDASRLLLIKFPGTGGRAECSSPRPAEHWSQADTVVWTINPFGYGNSSGQATLQRFPEMVEIVAGAARARYPRRQVVVYGNSLGTVSALLLAARYDVAGVYLRNPVPLHQLIRRRPRYAWPTLGLSRLVASQIPTELDAVENAKRCRSPCLFVSSRSDRVVPVRFQHEVIDRYGGEKQLFSIPGARHHDAVPGEMHSEYHQAINWLGTHLEGCPES